MGVTDPVFPDAEYLIVASRLIPDLDGGFTLSVLRRAREMAAAGAHVRLLTLDSGTTAEHTRHREEWQARRLLGGVELINLFDAAREDAEWLRRAALPLASEEVTPETRPILARDGRIVMELPVVPDNPDWYRLGVPVVVYDKAGREAIGRFDGFGGLYRAWLNHWTESLSRRVVIICEARQVGEVLVADALPVLDPAATILHATHACHVLDPYHWDSPMDRLWTNWFATADRYDRILWLTASQEQDVDRRFTALSRRSVTPHPAPAQAKSEPVAGRLVMVGSLISRKRMDHGILMLAELRAQVPHAELHIYGGGPEQECLAALADELAVTDAVVFHGHVSDTADAWRTADLFIYTSTNEGLGLVLLEALAYGVPIVAYDMRYGPRDVLAQGGGRLVPVGDISALANATRETLQRRDAESALARAAAERMTPQASMRALASAVTIALSDPAARPGRAAPG